MSRFCTAMMFVYAALGVAAFVRRDAAALDHSAIMVGIFYIAKCVTPRTGEPR